ncbi:MAG: BatD family protein [Eudoraea sp.]|nr:BatD family protein [Eudoraea sp.]
MYKILIKLKDIFGDWSGPVLLLFLLFITNPIIAQVKPVVLSKVDTTNIKIGEQIKFTVTVEADSTAQVFFPEGQTFSPLETVEAFKTDTTRKKDRITLQKIYALTQFDSGSYVLPAQRIEINGAGFFTDSLRVDVATVPVDTVNQKMYDIKPLISVQKSNSEFWKILLIVLLIAGIAGGLIYWFVIRKKPLTEEEKVALLPPYDRALLELKKLENSKYLIQDKYKAYYSELTAIVRSYLEEEVNISALESTTSELIHKLEMLKDAGELKLQDNTIKQFENILQTADLVKFARSKPPTSVAEKDRKAIEEIVVKTKEALPEPTEEELLEQEEYQEIIAQKKRKKKIISIVSAAAIVLLVSLGGVITYLGPSYVWDTITGHPTKTLLEGEWVSSSYGYPPIIVETPEVLVRQEVKLPPEAKANIKELQAFMYRSKKGLLTIGTTSTTLNKPEEPDFNQVVEQILQNFENQGAKNIITKQEEFVTLSGVKGVKVFGRGNFALPDSKELAKGQYTIILFGGNGFQQHLILSWLDEDVYAEEIVNRIIGSLEVKTEA